MKIIAIDSFQTAMGAAKTFELPCGKHYFGTVTGAVPADVMDAMHRQAREKCGCAKCLEDNAK